MCIKTFPLVTKSTSECFNCLQKCHRTRGQSCCKFVMFIDLGRTILHTRVCIVAVVEYVTV